MVAYHTLWSLCTPQSLISLQFPVYADQAADNRINSFLQQWQEHCLVALVWLPKKKERGRNQNKQLLQHNNICSSASAQRDTLSCSPFPYPCPSLPTYRTTYESCAWPTMCIWLAAGPSVECTHTLRGAYACVIISWSCATGQRLALLRWGLKELWNSCRLPDTALSPPTTLQTNVTLHNAPPMLTDSSLSKTRLLFWGKALRSLS